MTRPTPAAVRRENIAKRAPPLPVEARNIALRHAAPPVVKGPCPLEHEEQAAVVAWARVACTKPGFAPLQWLHSIPNFSGRLGKVPPVAAIRQAKALNEEGRREGVPDLFLPCRRAEFGGLYVEMKRLFGSQTSPQQRAWHVALRDAGYRVEICRGAEAAKDALTSYVTPE